MSEPIKRKLNEIHVSWGHQPKDTSRAHEGVNFALRREGGITKEVFPAGQQTVKDVPVSEVIATLRRIRDERAENKGVVQVCYVWGPTPGKPDGQNEMVYRRGSYGSDKERWVIGADLEVPLKSTAAEMIRLYVETGCEGTLFALQDYLSDKFPSSVVVTE